MAKVCIVILITALPLGLHSEDISSECRPFVYVLFANGMNNPRHVAKKTLEELISSLTTEANKSLGSFASSEYSSIAYNHDSALILELLEVYEQKRFESLDNFWGWFFDATNSPEWFKEIVKKNLITYQNQTTYNKNLQELISQYESILDQGFSILTVAHSQGNLFTNSVYDHILQSKRYQGKLAMVSVATPASRVSLGGPYITLTSDGVINLLVKYAIGYDSPLPPSHTNFLPKPGLWDHSFGYHYLQGKTSGNVIKSYIKEQKGKLEKNVETSQKKVPDYCVNWFNKAKDIQDKNIPQNCLQQCVAAMVGMETYDCPVRCDVLCKCNISTHDNLPYNLN